MLIVSIKIMDYNFDKGQTNGVIQKIYTGHLGLIWFMENVSP